MTQECSKRIEEMCRMEFSKINGLYRPKDNMIVNPGQFCSDYHVSYLSVSRNNEDKSSAVFYVPHDCDFIGVIEDITVANKLRGRGFGRGMVEAIERIFRETGQPVVCAYHTSNPEFWEHLGYKLDKEKLIGAKIIS